MEDRNALIILVRSVEGDTWWNGFKIEKKPKTCEVTVKHACFVIEDLGEKC
tara:strand:- start:488 stop:640 length:153 start_codon:yes stop_codon:yes gene_type:complete